MAATAAKEQSDYAKVVNDVFGDLGKINADTWGFINQTIGDIFELAGARKVWEDAAPLVTQILCIIACAGILAGLWGLTFAWDLIPANPWRFLFIGINPKTWDPNAPYFGSFDSTVAGN